MSEKKWFRAKRYGYGWFPTTWQGWLTILIYLVLEIKLGFIYKARLPDPRFNPTVSTVIFYVLTTILTAGLIIICYKTGEKPSWRWGNQAKKTIKKKSR